MEYDGFTKLVEHAAGIDREAAERVIRAVLETLGERLGAREARALAGHLPPEARAWLEAAPDGQPFGLDEFVRRVAERARVEPPTAERLAAAVYTVLGQALDGPAYRWLLDKLPDSYEPVLPPSRSGPVSLDEFVLAVADRANADPFDAQRAIDAVLETAAACLHSDAYAAAVGDHAHVTPARAGEFIDAVLVTLRQEGLPVRYWQTLIRFG